jgi:D-alanine-D-alanine ligase
MRAVVLIDELLYEPSDPNFNKPTPKKIHEAEFFVSNALRTLGHDVVVVPATPDIAGTIHAIQEAHPDFVFNLVEEIGGHREYDNLLVQVLEVLGIPYTGGSPETLVLTRNKHLSKFVVAEAGVEVPEGIVIHKGMPIPEEPPLPAIIKPMAMDGSEGITSRSYVTSRDALERRAAELWRTSSGPLLCEEYVPGREIIVTLSGTDDVTVDSICELVFPETSRIKFATQRAKFDGDYRKSVGIYYRTPTELDPPTHERVVTAARTAYQALRINAYAKVELRVSDERAVFIEANSNSQMSRLAKSTDFASIGYETFIAKIVTMALERPSRTIRRRS